MNDAECIAKLSSSGTGLLWFIYTGVVQAYSTAWWVPAVSRPKINKTQPQDQISLKLVGCCGFP